MAQDSTNRKEMTTCVMRNTQFLHPMMASWHRNALPCISLTKDRECGALRFHSLIVWIFMRTVSCLSRMKMSSNGGFPLTKANDAERGCFLWSALEQTANQINRDAGDFRCHRAHYDITLMDRDFRRRDAHVAAPYWGHDLVLTSQGKWFPNFKTRPRFKRDVSLQWRCMSDRVSYQCQHDFCSRTFFLIYSVRCVPLPFLFAKPVSKTLHA